MILIAFKHFDVLENTTQILSVQFARFQYDLGPFHEIWTETYVRGDSRKYSNTYFRGIFMFIVVCVE